MLLGVVLIAWNPLERCLCNFTVFHARAQKNTSLYFACIFIRFFLNEEYIMTMNYASFLLLYATIRRNTEAYSMWLLITKRSHLHINNQLQVHDSCDLSMTEIVAKNRKMWLELFRCWLLCIIETDECLLSACLQHLYKLMITADDF